MTELNPKHNISKGRIASSTMLESEIRIKQSASLKVPENHFLGVSSFDDNFKTCDRFAFDMSIVKDKMLPLFKNNFRCYGNDELTNLTDGLVEMLTELNKKIINHIGTYTSSR